MQMFNTVGFSSLFPDAKRAYLRDENLLNGSLPLPATLPFEKSPEMHQRTVGKKRSAEVSPGLKAIAKRLKNEQKIKEISLDNAMQSNNINIINLFLSQYNGNKTNLFFCAVKTENLTFLSAMLDNGFDVNAQANNDYTALHMAAYYDLPSVFTFLLRKGAALYARTSKSLCPLHIAENTKSEKILSLSKQEDFIQHVKVEFIPDPLCVAVLKNDKKKVQDILKNDGDANSSYNCNLPNCTPLSCAVEFGNLELVKLLLEHSAETNNCKINGEHILVHAAMHNQVQIFEEILNSFQGNFPLDQLVDALEACLLNECNRAISDVLWELIPQLEVKSNYRYHIIFPAIENSMEALVKELIDDRHYNISFHNCLLLACEVYFQDPQSEKAFNVLQYLMNHPNSNLKKDFILSFLSEQTDRTILRQYIKLLLEKNESIWIAEQIQRYPELSFIKKEIPEEVYQNSVRQLEESRQKKVKVEHSEEEYDSENEEEYTVKWRSSAPVVGPKVKSSETPEEEMAWVIAMLTGAKKG